MSKISSIQPLAMLQYSHVWTLRSVIKERLKNETLLSKKNL